jgi:hypothetical protein
VSANFSGHAAQNFQSVRWEAVMNFRALAAYETAKLNRDLAFGH